MLYTHIHFGLFLNKQTQRWKGPSVQFSSSVVSDSLWPHGARQASLSITNSWSLPKLISIESMMPSNHLILCHPLLLLPSIFPSIRAFFNEVALVSGGQSIGASASASVLPMNIQDWFPWFDLLAVQGTLKSLLLHHNLKASILLHSAFFMVQLSHPYMTTGKTIAFTRQTFVGKVMSLLFNKLSRFVNLFFQGASVF